MDDEMAKEIENSVLERCSPHGDVVHVYIDRRSPFVSQDCKMPSCSVIRYRVVTHNVHGYQ